MMADPAGDIDLRIAEDSLLESPDMIITVLDDDGNPQSRSAREVLDEANRKVSRQYRIPACLMLLWRVS